VDILALARVFPVLRRVEAVAATRRKPLEIADAFELRRRAFAALRELFARLARQKDVVLFIDDLQWGDADSAALLDEILRPPDPPALLVIACYRSEEAATSPLLQRLLSRPDAPDVRRLAVEKLGPSESRELALSLADSEIGISPAQAELIARESAGNPFFINELARFGRLGGAATLDEMVGARVRQLPEEARRLLEIVAVAGRPLEAEVAERASGLREETGALPVLRASHMVRARGAVHRPEIECYHDRIREAVVTQIPGETLKEHHRRLAVALEASGHADPEEMSLHFQEAGDSRKAADFATTAADRAAEALAFDRAARLYRTALELRPSETASMRKTLNQKMGDALVNAGRGADAAKAYLAAAAAANRAESLDLEQRAARHMLQSGRLDEALAIFENITGRVGTTLVQPSWRTRLLFLFDRALNAARGLQFRVRDASQVPPEQLVRVDTYWALASGLSLVQTRRSREFQSRHLRLALNAGEPYRVALAMCAEMGYSGSDGWRHRRRFDRLFRMAVELAERVGSLYALGLAHSYGSAGNLFQGRWRECWDYGQRADAILRERCTGVAWELDLAHIVSLRGLFYLGGLKELALRLPALTREAKEKDDLIAVTTLRLRHSYLAYLASDEPEAARENLSQMAETLSRKAFTNPHYWSLIARGETALYECDARAGWMYLMEQWPRLEESGLLRLELYRIESRHLRARSALSCAVAQGSSSRETKRFLRSAALDTRRVERTRAPWASALARLLRSGIAAARGHRDQALRLLESSERDLARLDMALYAVAARRRRGQLLRGDEGAALVTEADAWMAGQDIKNPARMADMLAPGRWS
jgi:hypothetical protein